MLLFCSWNASVMFANSLLFSISLVLLASSNLCINLEKFPFSWSLCKKNYFYLDQSNLILTSKNSLHIEFILSLIMYRLVIWGWSVIYHWVVIHCWSIIHCCLFIFDLLFTVGQLFTVSRLITVACLFLVCYICCLVSDLI